MPINIKITGKIIVQVESLYGVIKTREVYEKAIEVLPDESAKLICIEYAELERKLGEVSWQNR